MPIDSNSCKYVCLHSNRISENSSSPVPIKEGGSQPVLGVKTQIVEGMVGINKQNARTNSAKHVPGAWVMACNQGCVA